MTSIDKIVLILEDSPAIANLLAHYLEETYKFKCKLFDTFQEAKNYFADHNHIRPVAAVVDLHLPDCTPEEAVKLTVAENIPTIVFTGNVSNSVRDLILQHGITDYVLKSTPNGIAHIGKMIKRLEANKEIDVLVVDDAPSMRKMIRTLLESQCFRVFETSSGKEAIEIVTSNPKIHIVVVDYFVQDMTGADLVLNLRNRYPIEKLGIIGMSAYGSHHMSADMIKYGADDFIIKPFLPEEFICRVNSMATHLEEFYFLQKLNVEKNNILGMIAHDVRGPLGAIDGACQLLLGKDYDKEKQHYFLNKIRTIIKDQLMLLSDLLDTTAIEEGRLSIDLNLNNLIELAKSRVEYFQIVASGKQIHVQLQIIDDIPSFLFDRNRLKQVVDNLISNAIKYSPPQSTITVSLRLTNAHTVEFSVADEGQGIASEQHTKLFNRFQTVGSKTTAGEVSVGLGLSICKSIVDLHDGSIGIDPCYTKGSRFFFRLQLQTPDQLETPPDQMQKTGS